MCYHFSRSGTYVRFRWHCVSYGQNVMKLGDALRKGYMYVCIYNQMGYQDYCMAHRLGFMSPARIDRHMAHAFDTLREKLAKKRNFKLRMA